MDEITVIGFQVHLKLRAFWTYLLSERKTGQLYNIMML